MKSSLELTIKSIVIGILLAMLLCGANIYLGLKIGSTISASIPASILSLGILRMFKKYSILENNISQTIASSGEALAGVFAFILPALIILGVWKQFPYWEIFVFGICGGFIGVVYSILLRKVLLRDKDLTFPEGQAIGKVLLSTNSAKANPRDFRLLLKAILLSGVISFCQNGLQVLSGSYFKAINIGKSILGVGLSFSPAVLGAGYLIGGGTIVAAIGTVFAWMILLPYFTLHYGIHNPNDLVSSAFFTWKTYIRPVGVGVFLFGGISTITLMFKSIIAALKESIHAIAHFSEIDPTERDIHFNKLVFVLVLCIIPIIYFLYTEISALNCCGEVLIISLTMFIIAITLILGFLIAAVAGYLVGVVGSSNSPVSGLYFIVVILICAIIKFALPSSLPLHVNNIIYIVLMLVAFIGFSCVITNENIQDYKSGQMVGATPYKQEIALFIGVFVSMLIAPIMINLVFNAYGIGGVVSHPGIDPNKTLSAPQASAIASLAKHIMAGSEAWGLVWLGIFIGFVAFIANLIGKKTGKFTCSPIMIALGLYLPPDMILLLFVGGVLRVIVNKKQARIEKEQGHDVYQALETRGSILVCGLIAGESLMGLILAVPFVIKQSSDALKIVGPGFVDVAQILSFLVSAFIIWFIYATATKVK